MRELAFRALESEGPTRQEAARAVDAWARGRLAQRMTLTALDARWSGNLAGMGVRIDEKDALNRAFAIGRKGNLAARFICLFSSVGAGKRIQARIVCDPRKPRHIIWMMAKSVDKPHQDARMHIVDGRFEVRQDSCGITLGQAKALRMLQASLANGRSTLSLPVEADRPDVTASDAAGIDTLLSRFSTHFNSGKFDRTHNLTLAARALNGVILKPGQRFSYNDIVGPRAMGRGFRNAIIFVKGKQEPGLGGGICQVSSTLYNTVLLAGLKVIERSHHSRTVAYVPPGRDATVAYGLRDFRFVNSNSSPVCVMSSVAGSRLNHRPVWFGRR